MQFQLHGFTHVDQQGVDFTRRQKVGYSFPSGHTQSAVGTFGSIAYVTKKKVVRIIAVVIAVLVPVSRMYIGVHTPLDVVVSVGIAVLLVFAFRPLALGENHKRMPALLGAMLILAIGYLCFVECYAFPQEVTASDNYAHGLQNAYTLLGCLLGMLTVYIVDEKWLNFKTDAVWWAQILKVIAGLVLVLVIKSGTKPLLNMLMGEYCGRMVRYFLVVIFAGIVWPLTFKWFSQLGNKE